MTINIEEDVAVPFSFDYIKTARDVIQSSLAQAQFPLEAEVYLLLTDDAGIHKLNQEYRQVDSPTDVLSFPMLNFLEAGDFTGFQAGAGNVDPETGEAVLGDIILNVDRVKQQALCYGHSEQREFAFLIVHSMLHLFGYDHMEAGEAAVMEQKQRDILEGMGILR